MKCFLVAVLIVFCAEVCLSQQEVDSIPYTAKPVFALGVNSPFDYFLDTFYIDSVNLAPFEGEEWMPVYQMQFASEIREVSPGFPKIVCYQRQEGAKKFYKELGFSPREGVLHDFSLEQGDTTWILPWWNQGTDSIKYVVDSTFYKNCITGDSIKHLYVTAIEKFRDRYLWSHKTVWIENIGDVYHPFLPSTCLSGSCESCYEYLKIFHNNEWIDVNDLMCEDLVSSINRYLPPPQVKLFPNPAESKGVLHLESSQAQLSEVYITELATGREFYREQFAPTRSWQLRPGVLKPGLYLVRIRAANGGEAVRKIVVR